ncbi:methyl-accepting chemotaxis protein [Neptunomonas japonica]|uniref:Methyl-accepting chemotaxis protein n=1 Tax=Neptunomonas japonica JAMM 1380 TaxID=1441457 RepID=A0A7R6PIV0_9GAMM|nr:methyl-accepting chemotaxis protein [Neptunomonas japonica]BBB31012.1 conserved hypothetical protein [Neptunomonas japonica JAMM 1380]
MNQFFRNLSLKTKIMGNAIILILLLSLCAGYAIYSMYIIGKELHEIATEDIVLIDHLTRIGALHSEQAIDFERIIHTGTRLNSKDSDLEQFNQGIKKFDAESPNIEEEILAAKTLTRETINLVNDNDTKTKFESVLNQLKIIDSGHKAFIEHAHSTFISFTGGDFHIAEASALKVEHEAFAIKHQLESLSQEITTFTRNSALAAEEHEHHALIVLSIIVIISIVLGLLISWLIANSILVSLRKAIVTASGDLTQAIETNSTDEVGELLVATENLRKRLIEMLSKISGTTVQLSAAAEEMSVITAQTSLITEEQSAETQQASIAMNEMASASHEVAINIAETAQLATGANEQTSSGNQVVHQAIKQINKLANQIENSSKTVNEVQQNSDTISSVLDVIKTIAEQTNLLALNAAIEAARAGDQGRGFAVVADEVRTLAQRTQTSTSEINQMIEKLQTGASQAVKVMELSKEEANIAVNYAVGAGEALESISESVDKISGKATQISSAAEEQGSVIEEINANISRINEMSNQTAVGAEETATSSQALTRMATELQSIVYEFKT